MQDFQRQIELIHRLISEDPREALRNLREFEEKLSEKCCLRLAGRRGALLVDLGSALDDTSLLEEGIGLICGATDESSDIEKASKYYNLSNAHYALYLIQRKQSGEDFGFNPDTTPLLDAKVAYIQALELEHALAPELRPQLRTNWANCLSGLGRTLEAISEYDVALHHDPTHPIAWGNLGIEVAHLFWIAPRIPLLRDAARFLERALESSVSQVLHLHGAEQRFRAELDRINSYLQRFGGKCTCGRSSRTESERLAPYVDFCRRNRLFLNLSLPHCGFPQADSDYFSFQVNTPIEAEVPTPELMRVINEIKERYACARLLLFESQDVASAGLSKEIDDLTEYCDLSDHGIYGTRVAKLKLALEAAFNALDKVALLLNRYVKLDLPEDKVCFWNVLGQNRKECAIHSTALNLGNKYLFALYDVARDFRKDGRLFALKEYRNRSTHRYVVPHMTLERGTINDDHQYHVTDDELFGATLRLVQLVRCAVVYLIAFIDVEERKKVKTNDGVVPQVLMKRYRP